MTETLPISVVLATFNGERYLPEQLESLAAQRRPPAELLVGDDGSSDATLQILHDFASRAPFPIHIARNHHRLGYADNFLTIAARCEGDIVAFCDQDDMWHPKKLELIEETFLHSPECVLACHYSTVADEAGSPVGRRFPRQELGPVYRPPTLHQTQFPGFSLAVRRWLLSVADAETRPPDAHAHVGRMGHDAWLWLLAGCVGDVVVLPEELVLYRQHENLFGDSHVSWQEKVWRLRAANASMYQQQSADAGRLAAYLRVLADRWVDLGQTSWAASAEARAKPYESFAIHAAARAHVYGAPTRWQSVSRWVSMHRTRESWRSVNNRSVWSPFKDLVSALARPRGMRS